MKDDWLNDYKGGKCKDQARGKQEIQVSNTAGFQVILYNILPWHAIRFVEHDAIRAFQDSLFACLIFHAKGVLSLCLCRLDARACNIPKPGSSAVTIEIIPRMQ